METNLKHISTMVVLSLFLCLNAPCAWAKDDAALKVVKSFAKTYFMLDDSMAEYLSKNAKINDNKENMVELFLEKKAVEAINNGYKISFLQKFVFNIETNVLNINDSSAKIQFNATTIRNVNPLYRIFGSFFGLLEKYKVQEILTVVKENGEWKIGPGAFDMPI